MRTRTARLTAVLMAVAVAATLAGPAAAMPATGGSPLGAELARARAATARFHDVAVAEAAGYQQVSPCIALPDGAAMGHHYVRFDLLDDVVSAEEPEALLYVPAPDGRMRLVGVEYLSTDADATLFGQHFHAGPAGAALHVWLWQANPDGLFADFNPNVSC
jgi:hypothetical protein